MKKIHKLTLFSIALFIASFANAQVLFEWQNTYDHGAIDMALDVRNHNTTSIHVAGVREGAGGWRIVTQKYSPSGTLYWTRIANTYLPGDLLFIDRDGDFNTFVITNNPGGGYYIIKYNYSGTQAWKKKFSETPVGLKVDGSGKAYTGGQAVGGFFARCYRSDGSVRWARYDADGAEARGMDIDNSGNIYVGGINELSPGDDDIRVTKFGLSSTTPIWATNYDSGGGRDNVHLLKTDAAGNVYTAGEVDAYGSMLANVSIAKFNSSGVFQWSHFVTGAGGPSSAFEKSLIVDPFQNPVLTGVKTDFYNVNPAGTTSRIFTTKLNRNTGAALYYVYPNDPTYTDIDISESPVCSFSDQYGNIYIGGSGNQGGGGRWTITKVDGLDGTRRWIEAGTSMTGGSAVNDVYVAGNGDVYMANQEMFATIDYEVVKYSQPGGGLRLADTKDNQITAESANPEYSLFPNPSSDVFNIYSTTDDQFDITIFDNMGKLVEVLPAQHSASAFGEKLSTGMYFVRITNAKEERTLRIIKN